MKDHILKAQIIQNIRHVGASCWSIWNSIEFLGIVLNDIENKIRG